METWSSRLGVGCGADPTPEKVKLGNLRCGLGIVGLIGDDWERSIKEAKIRIGL
jgi:hypothetical protein